MIEAGKKELPQIVEAIEKCFQSVGLDVDSASTPDGRPVYSYNLGAINHSEEYLLSGIKRAFEKAKPRLAEYAIQWRRRPYLRLWVEDGRNHICLYMRFATNPILSTPLDLDPRQ